MKRFLSVVLMILLLVQALPAEALAATGGTLSAQALASARDLAGVNEDAGVYHTGMPLSAAMNAGQLVGWLEDVMENELHSVGHMTGRVAVALEDMRRNDPGSVDASMRQRCLELQVAAEDLRETLRFYKDRLEENAAMIRESSDLMQSDMVYDFEVARYSQRILGASRAIGEIRDDILLNADGWQAQIAGWSSILDGTYSGSSTRDRKLGAWIGNVFLKQEVPEAQKVRVTVTGSATLKSRLVSGRSVLSQNDGVESTVQVLSDKQIAIVLKDSSENPVAGAKVRLRDADKTVVDDVVKETEPDGKVVFEVNRFTVDEDNNLQLSLEVDASGQNRQSVRIPWLEIRKGTAHTLYLEKDDGSPYVYMGSFRGRDMMHSELVLLYSSSNDRKVDIVARFNNTTRTPLFCWKDQSDGEHYVRPTSSTGGEHVFSDQWLKKLKPSDIKETYFRLDGETTKYPTMLKPIYSVFDKPTSSSALFGALEKGFGFSWDIKQIKRTISLSIGVPEWLPKITVDPLGNVTLSVGYTSTDPEKGLKQEWQDCWADDYKKLSDHISQNAMYIKQAWKDNVKDMKQKKYRCFNQGDLTLGFIAILQGKWERENTFDDLDISVEGSFGATVSYTLSWTYPWVVGGIPGYLDAEFTAGLTTVYTCQLRVAAEKGKVQQFKFKFLKEVTIGIRIQIAVSVGVGFKDVLSIWVKGSASINLVISFFTSKSAGLVISASAGLTGGATFLIFTVSMDIVTGSWTLYNGRASFSLMDAMMPAAAEEEPSDDDATMSDVVESYPQLVPQETAVLSGLDGECGEPLIAELGGDLYAFLIQDGRIRWYNLSRDISGSLEDSLKTATRYYEDTFDVVGMKDYAFDVTVGGGKAEVPSGEKWTMDDCFVLAGMCAGEFDKQNRPVDRAVLYTLLLWRQPETGALVFGINGTCVNGTEPADVSAFRAVQMGGQGGAVDYIGTTPQILGMSFTYTRVIDFSTLGADLDYSANVAFVELGGDDPAATQALSEVLMRQEASFEGSIDRTAGRVLPHWDTFATHDNLNTVRVNDVTSGKGSDYVRARCQYIGSDTWAAVTREQGDTGGHGAIELYDHRMDAAAAGQRRSIVLTEGDIDRFVMVPSPSEDGTRTLFYVDDAEAEDDQAGRYRLKSLRIAPAKIQDPEKGDLDFTVAYTTYDVELGTKQFNIQKVHGIYYLYWMTAGNQIMTENGLSVDAWRVMFAPWDEASNTVLDDSVLVEFPIMMDDTETIRDLWLGSGDTGYFTIAPVPKPDKSSANGLQTGKTSIYSFPAKLAPVPDIKSQTLKDLVVSPADFDDVTVSVMNSGNVSVENLDINIVARKVKSTKGNAGDAGTNEKVIGKLHADLLHPENSKLTLDGDHVIKGEKACYRLEDYDFTPRQRDFHAEEQANTYTVVDGVLKSAKEDEKRTNYYKSGVIMPGSIAGLKSSFRIPEDWSGTTQIVELRIVGFNTSQNWVSAMAGAAGRDSLFAVDGAGQDIGSVAYVLDERTGEMRLAADQDTDGAARGFLTVAGTPQPASIASLHDLDVSGRIYRGPNGKKMLGISLIDHAETEEPIRLYCQIWPDGSETPLQVNLPYYPDAVSDGATHTFDLPLSALLDPNAFETARVLIRGVGIEEVTLLNNEITLYLDGEAAPLAILRQPRDVLAQPGETVRFEIEATGGVPAYSYQWQMWDEKHGKWVDLEGFTGTSLTRENIEKKWDGAKFRCVVTDRAGNTVISEGATLTVREATPTGDDSHLSLYLALAAVAVTLLLLLGRKTRREGKSPMRGE